MIRQTDFEWIKIDGHVYPVDLSFRAYVEVENYGGILTDRMDDHVGLSQGAETWRLTIRNCPVLCCPAEIELLSKGKWRFQVATQAIAMELAGTAPETTFVISPPTFRSVQA